MIETELENSLFEQRNIYNKALDARTKINDETREVKNKRNELNSLVQEDSAKIREIRERIQLLKDENEKHTKELSIQDAIENESLVKKRNALIKLESNLSTLEHRQQTGIYTRKREDALIHKMRTENEKVQKMRRFFADNSIIVNDIPTLEEINKTKKSIIKLRNKNDRTIRRWIKNIKKAQNRIRINRTKADELHKQVLGFQKKSSGQHGLVVQSSRKIKDIENMLQKISEGKNVTNMLRKGKLTEEDLIQYQSDNKWNRKESKTKK